ncbi:MAG: DUF3089 domain-containing protein [Kiritimatiellia bacterium]|jgi:hypothetical protein|nr:DUF3089 domain-containing protein [Pseudomonadales bacterium]MDP6469946.1 DUF3089 domain-containing protein [Pseudomonadales bacterium]MDP6828966.1 DUF3089 domain-containing protein [Pseudomonadales bacterium]MDP7024671.1 DUF3089 domain-containing protein [Kiritimatiellia bacterium]|tara:strand:- start:139 stop:1284 length:1146 start_codon:yes stop_codon:yes gene_type:complete
MKLIKAVAITFAVLFVLAVGLYFSGYGGQLAMWAFLTYNAPSGDFDPADAVVPPDYADRANWAALPDEDDPADLVPEGVAPGLGPREVDAFFIHPTGYLRSGGWTSPMDPETGTEENTRWMMANQASAFNGCCNVYAPRYREATIFSYFGDDGRRSQVLGFAYQDVKRAFEHFLGNHSDGRPFVIASHSQGTHHALRLLAEVIDPGELYERMVAAYLIGGVIMPVSPSWFASMSRVRPCQAADDLHCVVHWDTMPQGTEPMERAEPSLCTNPLTWRVDEELAAAELNEGAVVPEGQYNVAFGRGEDAPTGQLFERLTTPVPGQTWARCRDGSLFARNQAGTGFAAMGSDQMGTYHGLDYALFYMNIRNNALLRTARYLDSR